MKQEVLRVCVVCGGSDSLENRQGVTLFSPICKICKDRIPKIISMYKEQEQMYKEMGV